MSPRGHVHLFGMATAAWLVFWVIGLPSYYQQYSPAFMAWFDGVLLLGIVPLLYRVLARTRSARRMTVARWIAFYFTVPLVAYDWLYCGIYLGHGMSFLWRYWYITVYYVIPWIVAPGAAALAAKRREGAPDQDAA